MVDIFLKYQNAGKKITKMPIEYLQSKRCANINSSDVAGQEEVDKRKVEEPE